MRSPWSSLKALDGSQHFTDKSTLSLNCNTIKITVMESQLKTVQPQHALLCPAYSPLFL